MDQQKQTQQITIIGEFMKFNVQWKFGLASRYDSLTDVLKQIVYSRNAKNIARDLEITPSLFNKRVNETDGLKMPLEYLEKIIEITGDTTPIEYLIEKYLVPATELRDRRYEKMESLLTSLLQEVRSMEGDKTKEPENDVVTRLVK